MMFIFLTSLFELHC